MSQNNLNNNELVLEKILKRLDDIEQLLKTPGGTLIHHVNKSRADILNALARHDYYNYAQVESLLKLTFVDDNCFIYPPMRGWALSPDLALELYNFILTNKPDNIIEFGSGVSTIVIAKALRSVGKGHLTSVESSDEFAEKTKALLSQNSLSSWASVLSVSIVDNDFQLFDSTCIKENVKWYDVKTLKDENVLDRDYDLVFIDGPPGDTCEKARLPAIPFLSNNLSENVAIYLDDARRNDEVAISKLWSDEYLLSYSFLNLDKGAGFFKKRGNS